MTRSFSGQLSSFFLDTYFSMRRTSEEYFIAQVLMVHDQVVFRPAFELLSGHILQHAPDIGSMFLRFAICQVPVELALEEQMPGSLCVPVMGLRRGVLPPTNRTVVMDVRERRPVQPGVLRYQSEPWPTGSIAFPCPT